MARFRHLETQRIAGSRLESTVREPRSMNDVVNQKTRNRPNHKITTSSVGYGGSQAPLVTRFTNPPSSVRTLFTGHNISMISI